MSDKEDIPEKEEELEQEQEMFEQHRIVVDPGQSPIRIDKFLVNRLPNLSRNRIQNAAKASCIMVNDTRVKSNFKVKHGHVITLVLPKRGNEFKLIAQDIPIDIRFEDDHLMVVYKEAGMVVHPGHGNWDGTLVNALMFHYQNLPDNSKLGDRPGMVHRLDKGTTGLMVIAKSEYAMTHLARQFFDRTVSRTYQAIVWGEMDEEEGKIEGNIGRHPRYRKLQTVFPEGDQGKHAVSHYKVLSRLGYVSLVECKLETGRTHQIRVHFQHLKHPLFNDAAYGGDRIVKGTVFSKYKQFVFNCFDEIPRPALHAKTLGFVHPETGEEMFFDSDLPDDMLTVLDRWNVYMSSKKH